MTMSDAMTTWNHRVIRHPHGNDSGTRFTIAVIKSARIRW